MSNQSTFQISFQELMSFFGFVNRRVGGFMVPFCASDTVFLVVILGNLNIFTYPNHCTWGFCCERLHLINPSHIFRSSIPPLVGGF